MLANSNFYEAMYEALRDGLYSFDKNGKIIQLNSAASEMLGFSKDELLNKVGHNLFHLHSFEEQLPLCECPIYKAFQRGESYIGEEYFRKKDGSIILVEVSCNPVYKNKEVFAYVVLFRDITQKKAKDKQILALNRVVQESKDIIVIKDLDLKVVATNKAFLEASGKSSIEEMIGKNDAEIFGISCDSEPIKSYMEDERKAQKLNPGEFLKKEEPVIYPNGEIRHFRTMKFPIFDQGKLIATANISTDITGEKEYNKILEQKIKEEIQKKEENESFYNQIFQTANLGICLTNLEGRFVAVNPQYCNIYGYTQEELIGKHFTIVVPDEYKQTLAKLHDQFLKEKKGELAKEWEVVRKDGERIYILASASILENVIGGPYKITTISDVTEARKTRELQQRQEAMLIQQSKMAAMGEMLGAIAHQWRQPLNVINCTTLDMKLKKEMGLLDDRTFESSIHDLENLTQEMSRTIEDFMNFFKVDKKIVEIDINECFSYALKIFEAQFKNNGIEVLIDIDKNIKICGIMGELEQVFLNLLSNAKDAFLTSDKEEKRVKIYTQRKDGAICIIFEDNAQGIEEEKISKIFDPYFTTKKGGTGIGLYMSSLIISNTFGGKIYAQNIYKQGKPEGLKIICEIKKDQKC